MRNLSLGAAALAYAAHGWHVFPLKPMDKVPALGGGVHGATRDRGKIQAWWSAAPRANIGIALKASGLGCIDLDVKPDKGVDGRETFAGLRLLYGKPGSYALQSTPSGGKHYVFKAEGGLLDKVAWHKGVDLLTARHRYIVAAPSRTAKGVYVWPEYALEPWDEAGFLSPRWLELVRAAEGASSEREPAPTGEYDLLDAASLRVPGVDIAELESVLSALDPAMERDSWLRVLWGAAAQWAGTKAEGQVVQLLESWSSRTSKDGQYKAGEVQERWDEHTAAQGGKSGAGHVTWRSVRALAQAAGWTPYSMGAINATNWKRHLSVKKDSPGGKMVYPTAWNAMLLLAYHQKLKGSIKRNVLTNAIEIHDPVLSPTSDASDMPQVFNKDVDWVAVGKALAPAVAGPLSQSNIVAAAANAANIHKYDPIRQWIDGLTWDGVRRLDTWLTKACHAKDTPLNRAIGRAWMIGLAARASTDARGRGTKMDSVLVLQGPEGIGKSTVGSIIGGEWYASFSNSLQNDEVYYVIEKSIVLEFEELDAISRSEASRVKALVTTQADTFRRKWDASAQAKPRRCVFLGTVNDETFLTRDMTMRRWWIVRCPPRAFDLKWLGAHRNQLIAEARTALDKGEIPILPEKLRDEHKRSVEAARMEHPYEEAVREWTGRQEAFAVVGMAAAVEQVLGRQGASLTMQELRRFGECMRFLGWVKRHRNAGNVWVMEKL